VSLRLARVNGNAAAGAALATAEKGNVFISSQFVP
jgi:hypothetical protein